jgi:hypothetical protein
MFDYRTLPYGKCVPANAAPLIVAAVIACDEFAPTKWIAALLARRPTERDEEHGREQREASGPHAAAPRPVHGPARRCLTKRRDRHAYFTTTSLPVSVKLACSFPVARMR